MVYAILGSYQVVCLSAHFSDKLVYNKLFDDIKKGVDSAVQALAPNDVT